MSSQRMGFWKFIATGSVVTLVALAAFHFTWIAPQIDKKEEMSALVNAAHHVQATAIQDYALMPEASATTIDLKRPFPDAAVISKLLLLSDSAGLLITTEFDDNSMGNALALSNYVLTGNSEPQFLKITNLKNDINKRRENLVASVPLWPWS